jgi:hypothetical protein
MILNYLNAMVVTHVEVSAHAATFDVCGLPSICIYAA